MDGHTDHDDGAHPEKDMAGAGVPRRVRKGHARQSPSGALPAEVASSRLEVDDNRMMSDYAC